MIEGVVTVKYVSEDIVLLRISSVIVLAVVLKTVCVTFIVEMDDIVRNVSIVDTVVGIGNAALVCNVSNEGAVIGIKEAVVSFIKNVESVVFGISLDIVLVINDSGVVVVTFKDVVGTAVLKEVATAPFIVVKNVLEIVVHGVSLSVVFVINVCNSVIVGVVKEMKMVSAVSVVIIVVKVVRVDVGKNSFEDVTDNVVLSDVITDDVVLSDVVKNTVVIDVVEVTGISVDLELLVIVKISVII